MKQIPLHIEKQPVEEYLEELFDYCIYFHAVLKGFWYQDDEKMKSDYLQMLMERSNESQYVLMRLIFQYRDARKKLKVKEEIEILADIFTAVES